ncbi:hypothetical protein J6Z48_03020 [bacterium]|nr:hypothetical protein [bacterium]
MSSTVFFTIFILVLIVILFVLVAISQRGVNDTKKKKILEKVENLKFGAESSELAIRRDTIIKLDNLLSRSLQLYYNNDLSCGDNLKKAEKIFRKNEYNDLWSAHKMRNVIVHDDYEISQEEGKTVYNTYRLSIIKILR